MWQYIKTLHIFKVLIITYSDGIDKYNETYKINYLADTDTAKSRASTDGKELKIISYTLQDFVEKLLQNMFEE